MDFYFLERRARGSRELKEILAFQEARQREDVEHGLHRQPKHTLKEGHARAQQALQVKQTLQRKPSMHHHCCQEASPPGPGGVAASARMRRRNTPSVTSRPMQVYGAQYAISHESPIMNMGSSRHQEQARISVTTHSVTSVSTTPDPQCAVTNALLTTWPLYTRSQHYE